MMVLIIIVLIINIILEIGFIICALILNHWLDTSGLRYHLFDEGDNNGKNNT